MEGYPVNKKILFSFILLTSLVSSIQAMEPSAAEQVAVLDDFAIQQIVDKARLQPNDIQHLFRWLAAEVDAFILAGGSNLASNFTQESGTKEYLRRRVFENIKEKLVNDDCKTLATMLAPIFGRPSALRSINTFVQTIEERFFGDLRNRFYGFSVGRGSVMQNGGTVYMNINRRASGADTEPIIVKRYPVPLSMRLHRTLREVRSNVVATVQNNKGATLLLAWNMFWALKRCVKEKSPRALLSALKTPAALYCVRNADSLYRSMWALLGRPVRGASSEHRIKMNQYGVAALMLLSECISNYKQPAAAVRVTLLRLVVLAGFSPKLLISVLSDSGLLAQLRIGEAERGRLNRIAGHIEAGRFSEYSEEMESLFR